MTELLVTMLSVLKICGVKGFTGSLVEHLLLPNFLSMPKKPNSEKAAVAEVILHP